MFLPSAGTTSFDSSRLAIVTSSPGTLAVNSTSGLFGLTTSHQNFLGFGSNLPDLANVCPFVTLSILILNSEYFGFHNSRLTSPRNW